MTLPDKEKNWQVSANNAAASTESTLIDNQKTLLEVKNQLVTPANNPWVVVRSSDSLSVTGGNLLPNPLEDETGNGFDGTPNGLSASRVLNHSFNRDAFSSDSFRLTRSSDYIEIPHSVDIGPERTDPFTVGGWVKPDTVTADNVITAKYNNGTGRGWIFRFVSGGNLMFQISDNANSWRIETDNSYDDGQWHQVWAVSDGSTGASSLSIYVDGEAVPITITEDDVIGVSIQSTTTFNIGRWEGQTNVGFQGGLCDIAFFDTNLTSLQFTELYNNGVTQDFRGLSFASNLISWWRCGTWDVIIFPESTKQLLTADRVLRDSDGYDSVNVYDFSSYGNEGTYQNMTDANFSMDTPGGIATYSADFNGVDEYASISHSGELVKGIVNTWSISFWIKIDNPSASAGQIAGKYLSSSANRTGYGMDMDGSGQPRVKINLSESANSQHLVEANQDIRDGYWHHVVGTVKRIEPNNLVTDIYIDGVAVSTTLIRSNIGNNAISNIDPFTIGALDASQLQLEAKITECSLWGNFLREDQALELWNGGVPGNLWEVSFVNNLQGWWRLGPYRGNFGQNVSFDFLGKRPDSPESNSGQFSTSSILFDGNTDFFSMGDVLDKNGDDAFSISAWVYFTSNLSGAILSKFNGVSGPGWQFVVNSGDGLLFRFTGSGQIFVEAAETQSPRTGSGLFTHQWHHVAVTYDGSFDATGVELYLDGYQLTRANTVDSFTSGGSNSATLRIGITEFGGFDFTGYLDEISMWNRVLTEDEVRDIYNGGSPGDLSQITAYNDGYIDAWWRMGDGEVAEADLWVSNTDLIWSTTNRSWIVLQKPSTSSQLCLNCASSSPGDLEIVWSPSGDFRGGSTGSRPVASDQIILQASNIDWLNNYSTYSSWVHVWHTSDGKQTRIIVSTDQGDPALFWVFDEIDNPFAAAWTNPEIICIYEGANATNRSTISQSTVINTVAKGYDANLGSSFDILLGALGSDNQPSAGLGWITEQSWSAVENELLSSGGYHLVPVVVTSETTGARGVHGLLTDIWWTSDSLPAGTTFPDNSSTRNFAKFGQLVLPWTESDDVPFFSPSLSTLTDFSGNGNDGTLVASPSPSTDVPGLGSFSTSSISFNGSTQYVSVGDVSELSFENNDAFSLSVWFKTSVSAVRIVVEKLDGSSPNRGYGIAILSSGVLIFNIINIESSNKIRVDTNVGGWNDGGWHLCVATYDGSLSASGANIYVDGVNYTTIVNDTLNGTILTPTPFQIAARDGSNLDFGGNIDDVAVFNTELTSSDVTYLYNGGEPVDIIGDGYIDGYLAGYWLMGDALPSNIDNTADGILVGSGALVSSGETVTNYYMIGIDSAAPAMSSPAYHYWTVQDEPDLTGAQAGTLPFGGPLVNIEINAIFETIVNNV